MTFEHISHDDQFLMVSKVNRDKFDALMLAKKHICEKIFELTKDHENERKKIHGLIDANEICTRIIWGEIND